jgi:hypothetical protein
VRRDAGQKNDFAGRRDHQVLWGAANTDDFDHPGHLVADAWAGQGAGRSGDRQRAEGRDCRLASVRDFRWEAGRDCRSATDVGTERPAAQKRQPQGEQLLADPAVAGRGEADAGRANRSEYFARQAAMAGHEEQVAQAGARKGFGCAERQERLASRRPGARGLEQQEPAAQARLGKQCAVQLELKQHETAQTARERAARKRGPRGQRAWLPQVPELQRPEPEGEPWERPTLQEARRV